MLHYPKLKNPPITEALIDIQVILPPETDLDTLRGIQNLVIKEFPTQQERQIGNIEFRTGGSGQTEAAPFIFGIDGYYFISDKEKKVLQARLNGFTFSKLKPYKSWETLKEQAQNYWKLYSQVAKPILITRLAVKYINIINLPNGSEFKDYLLTTPEIAPGLPQGLPQYQMSLLIPFNEAGAGALVNQTINVANVTENDFSIIFDIDVFKNVHLEPQDEEIWQILDQLREIKNDIFFKSITKKTKEMYE